MDRTPRLEIPAITRRLSVQFVTLWLLRSRRLYRNGLLILCHRAVKPSPDFYHGHCVSLHVAPAHHHQPAHHHRYRDNPTWHPESRLVTKNPNYVMSSHLDTDGLDKS